MKQLLLCTNTFAQVNIRCAYMENYKRYADSDKIDSDEMILEIGKQSSEYYSLWNRGRQAIVDSLSAKGASLEEIYTARERLGYPKSTQFFTIYKHYPTKGELLYVDNLITSHYQYTEKMVMPEWEILMEKKEIAGYMCQKAKADYLGRTWIAWFTTSIPVSDGPWKLWGLPGLIIEANDSNNLYSFKCIEIKNMKTPYIIKVPKKNYIKLTKEKFMEEEKELAEDMHTFAKKRGKFAPVAIGDDGKPETPVRRKYNPIEQ
ncbi:GLPGLI family protein [Bacteroides sp. 519]|uniref:GLPGLI family protein n=1 Tax=Bacteroides sp. 519 TaxID=2302937 RepID=UPI001EF1EB96|nr:GLPGLI family protein [Bacteroides sp. 519]